MLLGGFKPAVSKRDVAEAAAHDRVLAMGEDSFVGRLCSDEVSALPQLVGSSQFERVVALRSRRVRLQLCQRQLPGIERVGMRVMDYSESPYGATRKAAPVSAVMISDAWRPGRGGMMNDAAIGGMTQADQSCGRTTGFSRRSRLLSRPRALRRFPTDPSGSAAAAILPNYPAQMQLRG